MHLEYGQGMSGIDNRFGIVMDNLQAHRSRGSGDLDMAEALAVPVEGEIKGSARRQDHRPGPQPVIDIL